VFELQLADIALEGFKLSLEFFTISSARVMFLWSYRQDFNAIEMASRN